MPSVEVQQADVRLFVCDVLVLKYAQAFYGADSTVARALGLPEQLELPPGEYRIFDGNGRVAAKKVLFMGTERLSQFDYGPIRRFSTASLRAISDRLQGHTCVAMTIHGMGYGLDERESLLAQLAGIYDFDKPQPRSAFEVSIVEFDAQRAKRLRTILEAARLPGTEASNVAASFTLRDSDSRAGDESETKPRVFVAMPFLEKMKDRFHFVLQPAAHKAGFLCEGLHVESYTGDVLTHIKQRIENSALIIADLTDHNPNVYLEVGYAWGAKRNVLFIAEKGTEPKFDVRGALCRYYNNMIELEEQLTKDLTALRGKRPIA